MRRGPTPRAGAIAPALRPEKPSPPRRAVMRMAMRAPRHVLAAFSARRFRHRRRSRKGAARRRRAGHSILEGRRAISSSRGYSRAGRRGRDDAAEPPKSRYSGRTAPSRWRATIKAQASAGRWASEDCAHRYGIAWRYASTALPSTDAIDRLLFAAACRRPARIRPR